MIKLRSLLENTEWAGQRFNYDTFLRLPPDDQIDMAVDFIQGPYAKLLTEPEVFHIILRLPRDVIVDFYEMATQYLSPEQLVNTKSQIEKFHK